MQSLTLDQIRASFVNTSKREAAQAIPTVKLDEVNWEKLDIFGWTDAKNPLVAYVIIPVDGTPVGIMLRASKTKPKKTMCAFCEDIIDLSEVKLFVAKFAGAAGRKGDTIGTLAHANFSCSAHARRKPNTMEGKADPEAFIARRVENLRFNSQRFAERVLDGERP